jgi:hypothetical protein
MPFPFPNDLSTATTVREGGNVFINAGRKKKKIVCKPRLSAFLSLMNDPGVRKKPKNRLNQEN